MAKRWTDEEDEFIVTHYDAIGSIIGPHDLGRSRNAVINRASELRSKGGWDAIERKWKCEQEYRFLMGKMTICDDDEAFFQTEREKSGLGPFPIPKPLSALHPNQESGE